MTATEPDSELVLRLKRMPVVDYDQHPGYAPFKEAVTPEDRRTALRLFRRALISASIESLRYRVAIQALRSSFRPGGVPEPLSHNGVVARSVDSGDINDFRTLVEEQIGESLDTVSTPKIGVRDFRFVRPDASEVFAAADRIVTKSGARDAAAAYLRRRTVGFSGVNVKVNDAGSNFKRNLFGDMGLTDPATRYLHIDSSPPRGVMKILLYLTQVKPDNGPFQYVLGSHRLGDGLGGRLIRRTLHRAGDLQKWNPESRRRFMALPRFLRRKAEIGGDLLDGTDVVDALLQAERSFTSDDGNLILFDNAGLHRGGLVENGRRVIAQIILR